MHKFIALIAILVPLGMSSQRAHLTARGLEPPPHSTADIPLSDVVRAVNALRPAVPAEFVAPGPEVWSDRWNQWKRQHEERLRQRLDRGDEDSVVNLWMFGTSFTQLPAARTRDLLQDGQHSLDSVLDERLDDLLEAIASSHPNERIAFVREFLRRRQIDPATRQGREATRGLLTMARERVRDEFASTDLALAAASRRGDRKAELATISTIFQDRGLSSDTSLLVGVSIDAALQALRAAGTLGKLSVRRVAILGPGLDFINKADGHDFYPQQTVQPFAVIDSLLRSGLSAIRDLEVTTIDVSSRVHQHLTWARQRAANREQYLLHLPLPRTDQWSPQVRAFWRDTGNRIGVPTTAVRVPYNDGTEVRALHVQPDVVGIIEPVQADIVTSRLVVSVDRRFDLVIATNVFVYYSPFEQALAALNVASLLRSGGLLLSNNDVPALPPMKSSVGYLAVKYSDRQNDHIFSYQRE